MLACCSEHHLVASLAVSLENVMVGHLGNYLAALWVATSAVYLECRLAACLEKHLVEQSVLNLAECLAKHLVVTSELKLAVHSENLMAVCSDDHSVVLSVVNLVGLRVDQSVALWGENSADRSGKLMAGHLEQCLVACLAEC